MHLDAGASLLQRLEQLSRTPSRPPARIAATENRLVPVERAIGPRPPALPSSNAAFPTLHQPYTAMPARQRRRFPLTALTLGVVLGGAVSGVLLWGGRDEILQRGQSIAIAVSTALVAATGARSAGETTPILAEQTGARRSSGSTPEPKPLEVVMPRFTESERRAAAGQPAESKVQTASTERVQAPLRSTAAIAAATACGGTVTPAGPGLLQFSMRDPGRAGTGMDVKVDGYDYRASFAGDGSLNLLVPGLSQSPAFVWVLTDGTPCRQTAPAPVAKESLQIALLWSHGADLNMHVVEPNAWVGSPTGDIHAGRPNHDGRSGIGRLNVFGTAGDSTRAQVYMAERGRLGAGGQLSAIVSLGGCAKPGQAAELRFEVLVQHIGDQARTFQSDAHALAFVLPPCSGTAPTWISERIPVKF